MPVKFPGEPSRFAGVHTWNAKRRLESITWEMVAWMSLSFPYLSTWGKFERQGLDMRGLESRPSSPLCLGNSCTLTSMAPNKGDSLPAPILLRGSGGAFGRVWRHFWLSHLERSTGMEQREARSGDNQPTYKAQDSFPRQKYSSSKHQCCRRWKPNTLHKPSCTHAMLHPKSGVETRGQWIVFVFSLIIVIEIIKQKCSIKRRRQS